MKSIDFRPLRYAYHIEPYANLLKGDAERDRYWLNIAQEIHLLQVTDVLLDLHLQTASLEDKVENERARHQLLYGATRRTRFVWDAIRDFHSIAYPKRVEPLKQNESFQLERSLNDIYIHSRGLLDNIAWAVYYQYQPDTAERLRPIDVDLFKLKALRKNDLKWLIAIVEPFVEWQIDFKNRRDPVAHRIPLSVPPSIMTPDEAEQRQSLYDAWVKAGHGLGLAMQEKAESDVVARIQREESDLYRALEALGTFFPYMSIDPNSSPVPLYPTVANDVGNTIEICWKILAKIQSDFIKA